MGFLLRLCLERPGDWLPLHPGSAGTGSEERLREGTGKKNRPIRLESEKTLLPLHPVSQGGGEEEPGNTGSAVLKERFGKEKNFFPPLGKGKVFRTFATRPGSRPRGKESRKKLLLFHCGERKSSYLCIRFQGDRPWGKRKKKKSAECLAVRDEAPTFAARQGANGSAGYKRDAPGAGRQEKRVALLEVL